MASGTLKVTSVGYPSKLVVSPTFPPDTFVLRFHPARRGLRMKVGRPTRDLLRGGPAEVIGVSLVRGAGSVPEKEPL